MAGRVESISIAPMRGAATRAVDSVRAFAGRGLEGDRYLDTSNPRGDGRQELTLIESEAINALQRDFQIDIRPAEARRNIVTRGARLNDLVGKQFEIGEVRLFGVGRCDPCGYLERMTARGVRNALQNRGGLRAKILSDGVIRVGDLIRVV